ncbi:hypothetical protein CY35_17G014800 [Sphagnum magellanicum]|nr:hypothetical protein CY35_17G014800 [Sphagnum magellanicum]
MPEVRGSFKTLAEKDFRPECQQCHLVGILVATGALGQWFWFAPASCEGR